MAEAKRTPRHRRAGRPSTPLTKLSDNIGNARAGLSMSVAASTGLALGIMALSGQAAAGPTDSVKLDVSKLTEQARNQAIANPALRVAEDAKAPVVDENSVTAESVPEVIEEAVRENRPVPSHLLAAADGSIAEMAMAYVGSPYVWGGAAPGGFDCSGLVMYLYGQKGVSLPHAANAFPAYGTAVSMAQAQPGDVIVYPGHAAIYVGNGMMVEAANEAVGVVYTGVRGGASFYRINH